MAKFGLQKAHKFFSGIQSTCSLFRKVIRLFRFISFLKSAYDRILNNKITPSIILKCLSDVINVFYFWADHVIFLKKINAVNISDKTVIFCEFLTNVLWAFDIGICCTWVTLDYFDTKVEYKEFMTKNSLTSQNLSNSDCGQDKTKKELIEKAKSLRYKLFNLKLDFVKFAVDIPVKSKIKLSC